MKGKSILKFKSLKFRFKVMGFEDLRKMVHKKLSPGFYKTSWFFLRKRSIGEMWEVRQKHLRLLIFYVRADIISTGRYRDLYKMNKDLFKYSRKKRREMYRKRRREIRKLCIA